MADDKLAAAIRQAEEALRAVPNWRELLCGGCGVCEGVKICSGDHESCGCHETLRLVSALRSLLAALPAEGEAPALTGLEAPVTADARRRAEEDLLHVIEWLESGHWMACQPLFADDGAKAREKGQRLRALLAAEKAPEPGTSFLAGGAPTRDSKLPPVTDDEAHEILSRFVASHFRKSDREHARFRIPADPAHDDDLRMAQYIEEARALRSRPLPPEVEAKARETLRAFDTPPTLGPINLVSVPVQFNSLLPRGHIFMHPDTPKSGVRDPWPPPIPSFPIPIPEAPAPQPAPTTWPCINGIPGCPHEDTHYHRKNPGETWGRVYFGDEVTAAFDRLRSRPIPPEVEAAAEALLDKLEERCGPRPEWLVEMEVLRVALFSARGAKGGAR